MSAGWGRSFLEQPICWSRWKRLRAWWYGYELPSTGLEALRMHRQGMAEIMSFSEAEEPPN